jgi:AbrB family looped-hinge helix DNA binding protein
MTQRRLVRVQEKGQVTLPSDLRKKLGLKKGDIVLITETSDGILISPQEVITTKALDEIGAILKEQGLSLEELIESGRYERGLLIREQSDLNADASGN